MNEEQNPQTSEEIPSGAPPPADTGDLVASRRPKAPRARTSLLFLLVVSGVSLGADLGSKAWAVRALERQAPSGEFFATPKEIASSWTLVLARNRGGAWGLLQSAEEYVRRPFFLAISVLAIAFIVSLYRRVHPQQTALKWGLPLVLGGALGNLVDRIRFSWVIDFIDYRATWVRYLNQGINKIWHSHAVTDHWPTFNVADIVICVGVGLMAIDMFTSRSIATRPPNDAVHHPVEPDPSVPQSIHEDHVADSETAPGQSSEPPPAAGTAV